jgi:hypothetical protein
VRPLALVTLLATACQAQGQPVAVEVVLRDASDAVTLRLVRTAVGCLAEPGAQAITANGNVASAGDLTLGPGPAGTELRSSGGTIARVVTEAGPPRRLSIIDPIGVPMVRVTFSGDGASATDAARAVVGTIKPDAGSETTVVRFVPVAPDIKGDSVVISTALSPADRLAIAAPLLVPAALPLPARALLACERLAAVTPGVK